MFFPVVRGGVPRARHQQRRIVTITSQGSSDHWSTPTNQRDRTQIVPGVGELLCKVFAQLSDGSRYPVHVVA